MTITLRSYPVCPHCGSWAIVERGVVGEYNLDAGEWRYGAGDDHTFECGDCDEQFQTPRAIAVTAPQRDIGALRQRATELRLSADGAGDRAEGIREAARALSFEADRAVSHNHKAMRDAAWLAAHGHTARAA